MSTNYVKTLVLTDEQSAVLAEHVSLFDLSQAYQHDPESTLFQYEAADYEMILHCLGTDGTYWTETRVFAPMSGWEGVPDDDDETDEDD